MTYFIRVSGEEEITVLVPKFNESNIDYTIQDEIVKVKINNSIFFIV